MNLTAYLGDSKTFTIPMRWENRPFVPGNEWHLTFTAKRSLDDLDPDSVFQKESGNGIEVTGSYATISMVRDDTVSEDPASLYWAVVADKDGAVRNVRSGMLILSQSAGRLPTPSIDIHGPPVVVPENAILDNLGSIVRDDLGAIILADAA